MSILGNHPYRNVIVFLIGTFISAFGAVLSTQSVLGVSPSSSIPFVCSQAFTSVSLGTWTLIVQGVFVILGFFVMGKRNYKAIFLLCIPTLIMYSLFTDLLTGPLKELVNPENMTMEWILIVLSALVHALGIAIQLISNLSLTPIDLFVNFVSCRTKREYGILKVIVDIALIAVAAILSFAFLGKLSGVGWGTVFAAIAVGLFVRYFSKLFVKLGLYEWAGHLTIDFKPKEAVENKE